MIDPLIAEHDELPVLPSIQSVTARLPSNRNGT